MSYLTRLKPTTTPSSFEHLGFNASLDRPLNDEQPTRTFDWNKEIPQNALNDWQVESLSVRKLLAGTIASRQIILGIPINENGDTYIGGGTFNATTWTATNGFILGLDDSDSNKPKFFIGDASSALDWNVTTLNTLTITGAGLVSPVIRFGKTSFTDSVNAGYFISSAGIYTGSAADASFLKYDISTATFTIKGTILTDLQAGSSLDGQFLSNLSVASAAIAASAVTTAKIAADAVTAVEIATGAVGSTEIAAGAVIAGKIAALTIVAGDIAAGTITGAKIAATTITAANIAALTITAAEIAAGTITAAKIAALTITASEIAASTITAAKMNVSSLSSISADIGTITAGTISVVNGGNTVGFTPSGTDAIFSGPTGAPTFRVSPGGTVTMAGEIIFTGTFSTAGTSLVPPLIMLCGQLVKGTNTWRGISISPNFKSLVFLITTGSFGKAYKSGNNFVEAYFQNVPGSNVYYPSAFVGNSFSYGYRGTGTSIERVDEVNAGTTTMTVSGTGISVWGGSFGSDDTSLFIQDGPTGTTVRRYTISGTTLTHAENITLGTAPATATYGMTASATRIYFITASSVLEYNRSTGALISTRTINGALPPSDPSGAGIVHDTNGRIYIIRDPGLYATAGSISNHLELHLFDY